ncbi:MAG TPA: CotO family spore coat protein, partial [Bacillota bacterium]|nr:CotO family spore coat protein [Bacillota bacterium]
KRIPVKRNPHNTSHNRKTRKKSSYFKSPHLIEKEQEETMEIDKEPDKPTRQQLRGSNAKKFRDMTIKEKVYYFSDAPALSPKLRCEVQTINRSYRGKIVDFVDNEVYIRVGRRRSTTNIPFDEIRDIRLLGF